MDLTTLAANGGVIALATALISVFKVIFEQYVPFADPKAKGHDATMLVLALLLTQAAAFLWAAHLHQDIATSWPDLLLVGFAYFASSTALYKGVTMLGGSVGKSTGQVVAASTPPWAIPVPLSPYQPFKGMDTTGPTDPPDTSTGSAGTPAMLPLVPPPTSPFQNGAAVPLPVPPTVNTTMQVRSGQVG